MLTPTPLFCYCLTLNPRPRWPGTVGLPCLRDMAFASRQGESTHGCGKCLTPWGVAPFHSLCSPPNLRLAATASFTLSLRQLCFYWAPSHCWAWITLLERTRKHAVQPLRAVCYLPSGPLSQRQLAISRFLAERQVWKLLRRVSALPACRNTGNCTVGVPWKAPCLIFLDYRT